MSGLDILYIVDKKSDEYVIAGIAERKYAEAGGLCHLTTIIVPFVADGLDKGKLLVHDRTMKQILKGVWNGKTPSWNFWGGHATAPEHFDTGMIGKGIDMQIFDDTALRELAEELFIVKKGSGEILEKWVRSKNTGSIRKAGDIEAEPYQAEKLIPVGYATYSGKNNVKASYVYAFPIPGKDIPGLIAADDYFDEAENKKRNVALPIAIMTEAELAEASRLDTGTEICDAITRLKSPENKSTCEKLFDIIDNYRRSD